MYKNLWNTRDIKYPNYSTHYIRRIKKKYLLKLHFSIVFIKIVQYPRFTYSQSNYLLLNLFIRVNSR